MNDATLTSWAKTLGVRVEERRLAGDRCGIYYAPLRLIILDEGLAGFQRRCTLCHELIHAKHHDSGYPKDKIAKIAKILKESENDTKTRTAFESVEDMFSDMGIDIDNV